MRFQVLPPISHTEHASIAAPLSTLRRFCSQETPEELKHQQRLKGLARQLGGLGGKNLLDDDRVAPAAAGGATKAATKGGEVLSGTLSSHKDR